MKKKIFIIFIIILLIIVIKYFFSDYKIKYSIDNYNIVSTYSKNRYYIEIDGKYNFDFYYRRSLSKIKILFIKEIIDGDIRCVYPKIKGITTYPLCYKGKEYTDYNLLDSTKLDVYKSEIKYSELDDTFSYNKNLDKNEYVLVYNYKGFYKMNYNQKNEIDIFKEDRYENSLMYSINNKILFPDYDEEYIFKDFYLLNIENSKYKKIKTKYEISYDSYVVGNIKNKVYLYDIKNSNLYEININTLKVNLIGYKEIGYYKIINGKKEEVEKQEYDNKSIIYASEENNNCTYFVENNAIYKKLKDNGSLNQKIFESDEIKIIDQNKNNLYFISGDIFYKYNPQNGTQRIFNYFELNFNKNAIIYVYSK